MTRIRVAIDAYILDLFPQSARQATPRPSTAGPAPAQLQVLALGLAAPSFWTSHQINQAFAEANRIWIREADIEFSPVTISHRTESVPADEREMWIYFVNHLAPQGRGIGVGFVYDLPEAEGGWGGGRIAVISGEKASEGLPEFPGNLLAHELGHVLIDDPLHSMANNDPSNLMNGRRNPRVANPGLLNPQQVELARRRAIAL